MGAIACRVFDLILPQHRANLCVLDYRVGNAIELNAPLVINNGFATMSAPEFAKVDYLEIGGDVYTEAEDYTALLPGEYIYNAQLEVLVIRVY